MSSTHLSCCVSCWLYLKVCPKSDHLPPPPQLPSSSKPPLCLLPSPPNSSCGLHFCPTPSTFQQGPCWCSYQISSLTPDGTQTPSSDPRGPHCWPPQSRCLLPTPTCVLVSLPRTFFLPTFEQLQFQLKRHLLGEASQPREAAPSHTRMHCHVYLHCGTSHDLIHLDTTLECCPLD